ncbi:prepilin-type N-terminal cleavage/methylation domain-containing protein [Thiomonas sp.]|uniref:prepilin-type N-terminal cleavage/methylation domain-containing protein n=1 Tax=Thiomonas sp. TaxID=2047785 RepID=UPI002606C06F|nr:prepilin-type N-terminal cleavage/methylation domain-containing protein [Thiomonas sp.]
MTRPAHFPRRPRQTGLTLIELMVAMLLGLVVVGAVVSVLLTSRQSYTTTSGLSQLQDNARIAFELMARDIRQAGSSPCGNTTVNDMLAGNGWYRWVNGAGLFGVDDATNLSPLPASPAPSSGFPALVTRGAGTVSASLIQTNTGCSAKVPMQTAPSDVGITANDLVFACDGTQAYVFQAAAFNAGLPLASNGTPGNSAAQLSCQSFGSSAYVAPYQAYAWYVGPAGQGAPQGTQSLYRAHYTGNQLVSDEIVRGVTNLQISYLTTGPNLVNAGSLAANAWNTVNAVRLALTLQTVTNPQNTTPNQERLVRTLDTTIRLR